MGSAIRRVLDSLQAVKRSGDGWMARCPAHDDRQPSLSIRQGEEGRVLLKCQAGCDVYAVCAAMGMSLSDLFDDKSSFPSQVAATYDYVDESGQVLYQVVRLVPKAFRQRHKVAGEWVWKLDGVRRVPYRLPRVVETAKSGGTVYVVEGEKDVEAIERAGAVATCNAGGAGKWREEYSQALAGANVIVVADRDQPGRAHAAAVAASLRSLAASVTLVEARTGKDASDHLKAGYGLDAFVPASDRDENGPRVYAITDLHDLKHSGVEWVVEGYVAEGMITQLSGSPKEGKSTFVSAMTAAIVTGRPFIGQSTRKGRVLYFTEEGAATFLNMMKRVCAENEPDIKVLLRSEVFGTAWTKVCEYLRHYCRAERVDILIIDTFTDLAGLADDDENVSGAVLKALLALRPIATDGVAILIVRHDRKGGGSLVERARGSSAFAGAVDIVMAITKSGETQREIEALGRPEGIPDKLHVDFDGIEFLVTMDPRQQRDMAFEREVLAALPRDKSEAIDMGEICRRLNCSPPTVRKVLKRLKEAGAAFAERGAAQASASQAIGWWSP